MATSIHDGALIVRETLQVQGDTIVRPGTFKNADISDAAGIENGKLIQQHKPTGGQANGADVVTESRQLFAITGLTGKVTAFRVTPDSAPSGGGDKQYTVDLFKGNAATPYATILSTPLIFADVDADRDGKDAVVNANTLDVGDSLLVVITATGSSGNQGQGVNYVAVITEDPV